MRRTATTRSTRATTCSTGARRSSSNWIEPEGNASGRDPEGTYEAHYEPFAVDGERVVAVGTSTYYPDATRARPDRVYHNVFLIEFDGAGRCRDFNEFFMKEPERGGLIPLRPSDRRA